MFICKSIFKLLSLVKQFYFKKIQFSLGMQFSPI